VVARKVLDSTNFCSVRFRHQPHHFPWNADEFAFVAPVTFWPAMASWACMCRFLFTFKKNGIHCNRFLRGRHCSDAAAWDSVQMQIGGDRGIAGDVQMGFVRSYRYCNSESRTGGDLTYCNNYQHLVNLYINFLWCSFVQFSLETTRPTNFFLLM